VVRPQWAWCMRSSRGSPWSARCPGGRADRRLACWPSRLVSLVARRRRAYAGPSLLMRRRATRMFARPRPAAARAARPAAGLIVTAHERRGRSGLVYRDGLRRGGAAACSAGTPEPGHGPAGRPWRSSQPSPRCASRGPRHRCRSSTRGEHRDPLRARAAVRTSPCPARPGANATPAPWPWRLALTTPRRDPPSTSRSNVLAGRGRGRRWVCAAVRPDARRRLEREDAVVLRAARAAAADRAMDPRRRLVAAAPAPRTGRAGRGRGPTRSALRRGRHRGARFRVYVRPRRGLSRHAIDASTPRGWRRARTSTPTSPRPRSGRDVCRAGAVPRPGRSGRRRHRAAEDRRSVSSERQVDEEVSEAGLASESRLAALSASAHEDFSPGISSTLPDSVRETSSMA